ncbi:hypothetical protein EDD85DRAFT_789638 [Armillaria nabsnona]|nr:hypothetical protein EDD85DRAFT_789638 [Armillaria nabsnona]
MSSSSICYIMLATSTVLIQARILATMIPAGTLYMTGSESAGDGVQSSRYRFRGAENRMRRNSKNLSLAGGGRGQGEVIESVISCNCELDFEGYSINVRRAHYEMDENGILLTARIHIVGEYVTKTGLVHVLADINMILRSWGWLPLGIGVRASVEWVGLSSASNYEWFRSALSYTAIGFPSDGELSGELSQIPGCKTNEHEDKRHNEKDARIICSFFTGSIIFIMHIQKSLFRISLTLRFFSSFKAIALKFTTIRHRMRRQPRSSRNRGRPAVKRQKMALANEAEVLLDVVEEASWYKKASIKEWPR